MLTKQFHDEAVALVDNPRITASAFELRQPKNETAKVAQPLLVKLLMNGWITDKEKVFLDGVVPSDCLAFVIHGRDYIHPEGLELFPFEEIETTILHGGEAIFSHRYRPRRKTDNHQEYRIFSAAINPGEAKKLILGFFGPTHLLGTINEDCGFGRLVETFRKTYDGIKDDLPALRQCLSRPQATVLVSRSTGRVQALNTAAQKLFSRSDRTIVDISLDQLKYHLSPLLPDYNLKLENISIGDSGMSIVSLEPNGGKVDVTREIMHQLSNRMSSSVANINLTAGRFQSFAGSDDDRERYQLSNAIQTEAERLSVLERQVSLLVSCDGAENTLQTVADELRKAVTSVQRAGVNILSSSNSDISFASSAPDNSYRVLFESVLMYLADFSSDDSHIDVSTEAADDSTLKIRFETPVKPDLSVDAIHNGGNVFTRHIADLLEIKMSMDINTENDILISELTINK